MVGKKSAARLKMWRGNLVDRRSIVARGDIAGRIKREERIQREGKIDARTN